MFYDCPLVKKLQDQFLNKYFAGLTFESAAARACFFFYGTVPGHSNYNIFVHAAVLTFLIPNLAIKTEEKITILRISSNPIYVKLVGIFLQQ